MCPTLAGATYRSIAAACQKPQSAATAFLSWVLRTLFTINSWATLSFGERDSGASPKTTLNSLSLSLSLANTRRPHDAAQARMVGSRGTEACCPLAESSVARGCVKHTPS